MRTIDASSCFRLLVFAAFMLYLDILKASGLVSLSCNADERFHTVGCHSTWWICARSEGAQERTRVSLETSHTVSVTWLIMSKPSQPRVSVVKRRQKFAVSHCFGGQREKEAHRHASIRCTICAQRYLASKTTRNRATKRVWATADRATAIAINHGNSHPRRIR